jgi:hypothetical protein
MVNTLGFVAKPLNFGYHLTKSLTLDKQIKF